MTAYGIDFGTTNSAVAVLTDGEVEVIRIDSPPMEWEQFGYDKVFPSVMALGENRESLFGWEAKLTETELKIEAVKRLFATEEFVTIGGEQFLVDQIGTTLFHKIKRAAAEESGHDVRKAVVTIPANSLGLARQRTKQCAGMAGIEVLTLMNEPTAAAMAVTRRNREDQTLMVIDWGGGTLDVTILDAMEQTFIEQTSAGIQRSGGIDFDRAIMKWLIESTPSSEGWSALQRAMLRLDVEKAKILLSSQDEANIPLPDGDVRRLTRSEFEQSSQDLVDMLRIPVERCLRDLAAKSGKVDSLVLAGGTCKIPAVRALAEDLVGLAPESGVDPLTAIAEGAAIAAGIMQGELPDYGFFVSTEHALGTKIQNPLTGVQEFDVIIPRGRILPAEGTETYQPVYDDQESIRFTVMEGDPEKPLSDPRNVVLAEQEIQIPNPGPMEGISFAVTFKYDLDGIVHYDVVDQRDGVSLYAGEIALGVQRDKRQMVVVANLAQATLDEGVVPQSDEVSDLGPEVATAVLDARTKVAPFVDDAEAAKIMDLCEQIESSGGTDQDAVDQLLEIIHRYNYLL